MLAHGSRNVLYGAILGCGAGYPSCQGIWTSVEYCLHYVGVDMANAAEVVHSPDQPSDLQEAFATQVQKALSDILKSGPFRASKQSQSLLRYIVDQSLSGHVERLKERIIGAEVFGRAIDYDTNSDPIVRSRAVEVRKRLAQYYVAEGLGCSIRIEIIPGSYIANFLDHTVSAKESSAAEQITHLAPIRRETLPPQTTSSPNAMPAQEKTEGLRFQAIRLKSRWIAAAFALAVLGAAAFSLRPKDVVQLFWSPFLKGSKPVLIYTGANPVYLPSSQLVERFKATHHVSALDTAGHEFLVPVSEEEKLGAGDLVSIKDEFVTVGDVSANVGVATLLTRFKRAFDLRSGEDVAFGDLRESPTILIGAFNNPWTLQMTGDLPFVFGSGLTIRGQNDSAHQWHPVISSENKVQLDYALVARLPQSKTGGALLAIAGITQCGTRAAAEFITSQDGIKELIRTLPKDWAAKNLEIVLQARVVNDIPTNPTVVAVRTW